MRLHGLAVLPPRWTAHGLSFAQEEAAHTDVRIAFASIPHGLTAPVVSGHRRDAAPGDWLLRLTPEQRLRATAGRRITIDAPDDADQSELVRWLRGPATAAILYQRGLVPLHGSAVESNGALLAFLGQSGMGKSSIAAALVAGGATLVTDDLLAVSCDKSGNAVARPGPGELRIPPPTWAALGGEPFRGVRIDPDGKRLAVPKTFQRRRPRPISALFVLEYGPSLALAPVDPVELLVRLRRLLARPALPRPLGVERAVFAVLGQIARRVRAWRLVRPANGWTLPACQALAQECLSLHSYDGPMPGARRAISSR